MTAEFNIPNIPAHSILGLSYSGMHDSSIAIVSPAGEILFAVSLERISRVKQDGRYPQALLDQVPWDKIDKIALSVEQEYHCEIDAQSAHHPLPLGQYSAIDRAHQEAFYQHLQTLDKELCFVPHHLSHAASAFWLSDFESALCFVYDGGMANEEWFGGLFNASRTDNIVPVDRFGAQRYANVTHVYTAVTAVLGFSPLKHEGKITGLAAYGKDNPHCDRVLKRWLYEPRTLDGLLHWDNMYSAVDVPKLTASVRKIEQLKQDLVGVSREDLAFSVQKLAEHHVLEILKHWQSTTGQELNNVCLSGGLFANVKINQRISELGVKNLFVSPPMADDGTALGAALHVASQGAAFSPKRVDHVFLGPVSSEQEIAQLLASKQVKTMALDESLNAADTVARLLDDGAIIAVYQGRSEFGPRALGNRSILANADNADINRSLNEKLHRTEFMPFAPMCLKDDAHLYFDGVDKVEHSAQFMTVTLDCTEVMRQLCPAVVHCDNTARPQLVTQETNPFIYDVLSAYKALSGKPAIVNTSFNVHEEPIVCSAEDALKGFFESGLDYLYLAGHLIALQDNPRVENQYLKQKISVLRQQVSSNKQQLDEIDAIRSELNAHVVLVNNQEDLLNARAQEIAQRDQALNDIFHSSSWKITAPLRAISNVFK